MLSPDDGRSAAARSVVRYHLRAFEREEAGARAGQLEPVHRLRVATRRLRAALRLFTPVLPAATVDVAGDDLAWLGRGIGAVRDLDVLALAVAARARRLEPEMRAALSPLQHTIRARRATAHAELVQMLDSMRSRGVRARLAALSDNDRRTRQDTPLGEVATQLVRPLLRALIRAGRRAVDGEPSPEALHRVRVRGKRLRYALETMGGLGGRRLDKLIRRLAQLQELLGEHQDAVTQMAWLRAYAEDTMSPAATQLAVGAVIHVLARRARRLRRRFSKTWRRVDRHRRQRRLLEELDRNRGRRAAAVVRLVRVA
jgi:CHAD domain-containing protein